LILFYFFCQLGDSNDSIHSESPIKEINKEIIISEFSQMEIDLRTARDLDIDPSPFRVSELMPLEQVYILFEMLKCSRVFVTSFSSLVGVISPSILCRALSGDKRISIAPSYSIDRSPSSLPTPQTTSTFTFFTEPPDTRVESKDVEPNDIELVEK